MKGIVGRKLVRPVISCRVCFWPVTREWLPTPDLDHYTVFEACLCHAVSACVTLLKLIDAFVKNLQET